MQEVEQHNNKSLEQVLQELEKFLHQHPAKVGGMAVRYFRVKTLSRANGFMRYIDLRLFFGCESFYTA